jgi:hypothetical protein
VLGVAHQQWTTYWRPESARCSSKSGSSLFAPERP